MLNAQEYAELDARFGMAYVDDKFHQQIDREPESILLSLPIGTLLTRSEWSTSDTFETFLIIGLDVFLTGDVALIAAKWRMSDQKDEGFVVARLWPGDFLTFPMSEAPEADELWLAVDWSMTYP